MRVSKNWRNWRGFESHPICVEAVAPRCINHTRHQGAWSKDASSCSNSMYKLSCCSWAMIDMQTNALNSCVRQQPLYGCIKFLQLVATTMSALNTYACQQPNNNCISSFSWAMIDIQTITHALNTCVYQPPLYGHIKFFQLEATSIRMYCILVATNKTNNCSITSS